MASRPLGQGTTLPGQPRSRLRWLTRIFALHLLLLSILAAMAVVRAPDTVPGRRVVVGYRLPTRVLIEALRVGSSGVETERVEERGPAPEAQ